MNSGIQLRVLEAMAACRREGEKPSYRRLMARTGLSYSQLNNTLHELRCEFQVPTTAQLLEAANP